jgi:hypothetical protein
MKNQTVTLLAIEMDDAWQHLRHWIQDLTEEEFLWEPVLGCWTVRPDEHGRWVLDYALPDPDAPPFTTIAWRLIHIATCKVMYHEYAFGRQDLTWDTLEIPHTLTNTIALLQEGHTQLQHALQGLTDADLEQLRFTNWGEQWPTWRIFWVMIGHDMEHGAEIGCLRDLYRAMQHPEV